MVILLTKGMETLPGPPFNNILHVITYNVGQELFRLSICVPIFKYIISYPCGKREGDTPTHRRKLLNSRWQLRVKVS